MRRFRWSSLLGVALSIALAGTASGVATWGTTKALTTSHGPGGMYGSLVTLGTSTVIAIFEDAGRMRVKRSTDGGVTYLARQTVSRSTATGTLWGRLAGSGTYVDAAWVEQGSDGKQRVVYKRSIDSGVSFGAAIVLATSTAVGAPSVSRNTIGRVAVAFTDGATGKVWVRVSDDFGATFGAPFQLGTTTFVMVPEALSTPDGWPAVAVVGSRVMAVWRSNDTDIKGRRWTSTLGWGTTRTIVSAADQLDGLSVPSLAGTGSTFVLGWTQRAASFWPIVHRSTDGGVTWSPMGLPAPAWGALDPVVAYRSGMFRVAMTGCLDEGCTSNSVFYVDSADGSGPSWSSIDEATAGDLTNDFAMGVGYANGKKVVLYLAYDDGWTQWDIFTRLGAP